jgi:hypothetical protein
VGVHLVSSVRSFHENGPTVAGNNAVQTDTSQKSDPYDHNLNIEQVASHAAVFAKVPFYLSFLEAILQVTHQPVQLVPAASVDALDQKSCQI